MTIRAFLIALAAAMLALPLAAVAQYSKRIPQVGYLGFVENPELDEAFRKGLHERGYLEGQNVHVEYRYAEGRAERLAEVAAELVRLKVDVIVASSTQAIDAARLATKTIPIVFPVTFDPVESGYVSSLGRPGGNLTGLNPLNPVVAAKRVELLKEVIPRMARVAVLWNPTNSGSLLALKATESAAKRLSIRLQTQEARSPDDLEPAFRAATREQADALIVMPDNLFWAQRGRILTLTTKNRLPAMFDGVVYVEAGGLMSYGANVPDLYQRAAIYVDKILKGAKPADLPVEQATKFELFINLKTAKQIGLTIPPSVLLRADKVIE